MSGDHRPRRWYEVRAAGATALTDGALLLRTEDYATARDLYLERHHAGAAVDFLVVTRLELPPPEYLH